MANLVVTIPLIIDSETAIASSGGDRLAKDCLGNNIAGSGAFEAESWKSGVGTIYVRNDDRASGNRRRCSDAAFRWRAALRRRW